MKRNSSFRRFTIDMHERRPEASSHRSFSRPLILPSHRHFFDVFSTPVFSAVLSLGGIAGVFLLELSAKRSPPSCCPPRPSFWMTSTIMGSQVPFEASGLFLWILSDLFHICPISEFRYGPVSSQIPGFVLTLATPPPHASPDNFGLVIRRYLH